MTKITTCHVLPFNWEAFYDGHEERGYYGHGSTEREAIDDLLRNYPLADDVERMRVTLQLIASLPVYAGDDARNAESLSRAVAAAKGALAETNSLPTQPERTDR